MHYRELKVWQKAHALTLEVYRVTRSWPKEERFGLTSQVQRAAVSIEANLAEGTGRQGAAEYGRFVLISLGSARELDCELLIARDLDYLPAAEHRQLEAALDEIQAMLVSLSGKLAPRASRPAPT